MAVQSPFEYGSGGIFVPPAQPAPVLGPAPAPVAVAATPAGAASPAPFPVSATKTDTATPMSSYAPIVYGATAAAAPAAQAYDTTSGVIGTLGSAASGAATGALIGSAAGGVGAVPGAIIGGVGGLLLGGLNAFLSVGGKNKARRDQERLLRAAEEKQKIRDRVARDDAISQLAYDRKQAELQRQWAKALQVRQSLQGASDSQREAQAQFVQTGRI